MWPNSLNINSKIILWIDGIVNDNILLNENRNVFFFLLGI